MRCLSMEIDKGERREFRETTRLQNLVHNFVVVHKLVYQEKVSFSMWFKYK